MGSFVVEAYVTLSKEVELDTEQDLYPQVQNVVDEIVGDNPELKRAQNAGLISVDYYPTGE